MSEKTEKRPPVQRADTEGVHPPQLDSSRYRLDAFRERVNRSTANPEGVPEEEYS